MDDNTGPKLFKEQLRLAYGNLRNTFITVPVAVLVVELVELLGGGQSTRLTVWGALMLASLAPRYYNYRQFMNAGGAGPDDALWEKKYWIGTLLGGIAWGLTPLMLFPGNSIEHSIFITLVIGGMAAGASFAYAPLLRPGQFFMSLSLLPLVLIHILIGGGMLYGVAFMVFLYYLMIMISLKNNNRLIQESIVLGMENAGLVASLSAAKKEADADAEVLMEEVKERLSAQHKLIRAQKIAHLGSWGWNVKLNRFSMSDEACHILGLDTAGSPMTYETMIGAVTPQDAPAVKKALYETIFEFRPLNIEHAVQLADGTPRIVHQLAEIIYDEKGDPAEIEGTIQDITERKTAERKLRDSEERFRSLISSMQDAVLVLDRRQRFTAVFGKWFEREGVAPEHFIGKTYREMFGAEVGEIHRKAAEKALAGEPAVFQWSLEWQDNRDFYQTSLSPLVNSLGAIIGVVGVNRDITSLKEKEEELEAAKKKAEEATKVKDKFLSIVAHDIRGPFGTMLGLLKFIQEDEVNQLHQEHKMVIHRVLSTGDSLMEMFENLLEIGRLQTGSLTVRAQLIDVRAVVEEAIDKVKPLAQGKGVAIANEIPEKTLLYADISLLTTVFHNLLGNAVKFSRQGQDIRLFCPEGRPGVIAVKDGGTGINPKIMPDLFKPDVKTSTVGTAGERGTGLGLPFCQEIMKAHKGKISVDSTPGEGSTFYVEFPPENPRI